MTTAAAALSSIYRRSHKIAVWFNSTLLSVTKNFLTDQHVKKKLLLNALKSHFKWRKCSVDRDVINTNTSNDSDKSDKTLIDVSTPPPSTTTQHSPVLHSVFSCCTVEITDDFDDDVLSKPACGTCKNDSKENFDAFLTYTSCFVLFCAHNYLVQALVSLTQS